ncbi:hypothetical protein DR871_014670 [Flavobacterium petrolei]|uniref:HNH endonuclease n=1 Tax=Flavobacterium petrolei TaxID=2259594 RepID=A0A482TLA5_9FLAO|nr:hypothetical protein [Flavobacterium petrolei]RYJ50739.1 hypothetical protein DR871_014670 [Flavobacterium petrolei]
MINIVTKHTVNSKSEHKKGLLKKTKAKLNSSSLPKYLKEFIDANLSQILVDKPEELLKINKAFYSTSKGKSKKINSIIRKIFDYDLFSNKKQEYNSYSLADNLQINTCPNCNRQYTITVSSKKVDGQIARPDFDHYFPKSKYPLLSLSFYNLIPSCKICNSTFKGDKEMDILQNIHPYIDNLINDFSFNYELSSKGLYKCESISINFHEPNTQDRIEKTLKMFRIEETYNGHKFIVDQILQLKNSLNDDYLRILTQNTYENINWTPEDAYRIGFGVNYKDDELFEHPFSKLKRDIIKKEEMLSIFETK